MNTISKFNSSPAFKLLSAICILTSINPLWSMNELVIALSVFSSLIPSVLSSSILTSSEFTFPHISLPHGSDDLILKFISPKFIDFSAWRNYTNEINKYNKIH